jgi:hypothetical protein
MALRGDAVRAELAPAVPAPPFHPDVEMIVTVAHLLVVPMVPGIDREPLVPEFSNVHELDRRGFMRPCLRESWASLSLFFADQLAANCCDSVCKFIYGFDWNIAG